jgi:hypothetical protein
MEEGTDRLLPLRCQVVAHICDRSIEIRLRRQSWFVEATFPVDFLDLVLEFFASVAVKEVEEGFLELVGI